jgi:hypothetical protein
MNTITCPHCGKPVEISEALKHQIEAETLADLEKKHAIDMEAAKKQAIEDSQKKFSDQFAHQLKQKEEETREEKEQNRRLTEQLTQLMKDMRDLKREKDEVKLEMEKRLALEEDKIRLDASKKAEEETSLKMAAKDKQLTDALKEVEDMKRKLTQGSQQLQGEVFEEEFEQILASHYPHDKISPVGKGIRGGDIIQEVWDSTGNFAGKILWELKNTKTWSEGWVDKLKGDKREINAEEAIIITEVMPIGVKNAGFYKGVWVTDRNFVLPLADSIRVKLIQLVMIKNSQLGKDAKMESLYAYLTGTEFKNRIEAIVEAFSSMQQEVEKEKRYFANKWARDEKNIRQVIDSTYGMHGDLRGILAASVPQIAGLDMARIEDGQE